MRTTISSRKGPLKAPPLRQAGQSLGEQRENLRLDLFEPVLIALLAIAIAGLEWLRHWRQDPPQPWLYTLIALFVAAWAFPRFRKRLRELRHLDQGMDGEIHVGQQLETLRKFGFHVFHDIPGDGWNLDHVLIGTKGVFAIETKAPSKRRTQATIRYDGAKVLVNGLSPDRDPIVQAKAASKWLKQFIARRGNRKVSVQPVVIYPNWFVEGRSLRHEVWVENDLGFLKLMEREHEKLSPDDVAYLSDVLSEYVRQA